MQMIHGCSSATSWELGWLGQVCSDSTLYTVQCLCDAVKRGGTALILISLHLSFFSLLGTAHIYNISPLITTLDVTIIRLVL
jgi:hypothetical protein